MKSEKMLTKKEIFLLDNFIKMFNKGGCPTNRDLSKKVKMSDEGVRAILWKLVGLKLIKVNKKLQNKKFYV